MNAFANAFLVGLSVPVVAMAWAGSIWMCTRLYAGVRLNLMMAAQADHLASAELAQIRRGF